MSRRRLSLVAVLAMCLSGGAGLAHAQSTCDGDSCEGATDAYVPSVDNRSFTWAPYTETLKKGQAFLCGQPADARRQTPDVDCRIHARISIPAKAAKYLGLSSRVLTSGDAGGRVDHYKNDDGDDQGRAYFLRFPASLKPRLKAKHVVGLGVTVTGTMSVPGQQVHCASDPGDTLHPSCPISYGRKLQTWPVADGQMACWAVMPWAVAIKSVWGKRCPRPIHL